MNTYTLKKSIRDTKAKAKKLVDACENRDMSPDEKEQFDACIAEVASLRDKVEKLALVEDEEEEEEGEEEDKPEPRSRVAGRASNPQQWTGQAPAVQVKRDRPYSLLRAMRLNLEQRTLDGVEGELSQELAKRSGKQPQGFYMPTGLEPEYRDLTTTTGSGAVFVLPELPFIELLRNKMVVKELGATFLSGMTGKFSVPRMTSASTAQWIAETVSVSPSNQTLDQVAFVDKTLAAATNLSRKFLYQSSVDAESFVKNDLALVLAIELDRAALNGSGAGAQPTGLLQNSTIQTNSTVALGTNGGSAQFADLVRMESIVASFNADRGNLRYVMSPALRGKLKGTQKATNYPAYVFEDNEVNGYPALASNQVPSNLTKGTGTNLSACIFGNWNDLIVATWGGIDVVVNIYSGQLSGAVQISMLMEADIAPRHAESFALLVDGITS